MNRQWSVNVGTKLANELVLVALYLLLRFRIRIVIVMSCCFVARSWNMMSIIEHNVIYLCLCYFIGASAMGLPTVKNDLTTNLHEDLLVRFYNLFSAGTVVHLWYFFFNSNLILYHQILLFGTDDNLEVASCGRKHDK